MRRRLKIALAAAALAGAAAVSYTFVAGMWEPDPVLAQLQIGTAAPDFRATNGNGRAFRLSDFRGRTVVLEWNNPDCPTVREHYENGSMQNTQAAAAASGAVWLTINSSAQGKQGHMTPAEASAFTAGQQSRRTAYLLDPDGAVGRRYGATATPHMFVISPAGTLVYNGAMLGRPSQDDAGSGGARNHVLAALSEIRAGRPVSVPTSRPYGCSVKYSNG